MEKLMNGLMPVLSFVSGCSTSNDAWIKEIWNFVQNDPQYKEQNCFSFHYYWSWCDKVKAEWTSHGNKFEGRSSEYGLQLWDQNWLKEKWNRDLNCTINLHKQWQSNGLYVWSGAQLQRNYRRNQIIHFIFTKGFVFSQTLFNSILNIFYESMLVYLLIAHRRHQYLPSTSPYLTTIPLTPTLLCRHW
jgi:hypothetical protein